jgi:hypothetical protein
MSKEIEKKFEEIMKKEGMEKLTKSTQERFEELMKKQGMEQLEEKKQDIDPSKPIVYIVKFPIRQGGGLAELEIFKTKEERDKWYKMIGREIENAYGEKIVFSERNKEPNDKEYEEQGL